MNDEGLMNQPRHFRLGCVLAGILVSAAGLLLAYGAVRLLIQLAQTLAALLAG